MKVMPGRLLRAALAVALAVGGTAVIGTATAFAVPPGYSVAGTDVSNHDGTINWSDVAAKGVKFGWAKASEGTTYTDPYFTGNQQGAAANGIYLGAYSWGRPDQSSSGATQADFLLDRAHYVVGGSQLPPQLDIESGAGVGQPRCYNRTSAQIVAFIHDFVNEIKARTGREAAIYTNTQDFWIPCTGNDASFGANPLEIASYNSSPGQLPASWSRFTAWQYQGNSTSLPGSLTTFNGNLSDLAAFAGGQAPPPQAGQVVLPPWPNMVQGDSGANVKAAQYLLRYRGEQIDADGQFGSGTRNAVLDFQNRNSLHVDGEIGPQTWGALLADVKRGANSEAVKGVQTELNRYGYGLVVDGDFGGNTDAAVRSFQTTHGLVVDGDAGPKTWQALVGTRVISLRAHANDRFVTAENGGTAPLIANRTTIGPWEQFDSVNLSNGDRTLVAHANNRFVTAENGGSSSLIANRTSVGLWQDFQLVQNGDGSISLKALVNGKYVTAENGGAAPLIANRDAIGPWEEFDVFFSFN